MQYFNNNNEFSLFLGERVVINAPNFQFTAVDYLQPTRDPPQNYEMASVGRRCDVMALVQSYSNVRLLDISSGYVHTSR